MTIKAVAYRGGWAVSDVASATYGVQDFTVSASPSSNSGTAGGTVDYTVTTTAINGFNTTQNFSVSGLPSGVTASFSPSTLPGSGSTTMVVTVPLGTPPGTSALTITASSTIPGGTLSHSAGVSLVIGDSAPSYASVTPASGSGWHQTYTFIFSDPNGATDISSTQMDVGNASGTANSCVVFFGRGSGFGYGDPSMGGFWLEDDAGQNWSAPATVGQPGTLENSQCIVDAGASSLQLSGTNLTITVAVSFKASYAGAHTVWDMAVDNEGLSSGGYYGAGSYTVTSPPAALFSLAAQQVTPQPIAPGSSAAYTVTVTPQSGFSGVVNLENTALATGETAAFAPSSVSGGSGTATLTVNTDSQATPTGSINFSVIGMGQQGGGWVETATSATLDVEVLNPPPAVTLASPLNNATNQGITPALQWNAAVRATSYDVYLYPDSGQPVLAASNVTTTTYTPNPALAGSTVYSWYVIAKNAGGSAPQSAHWKFTTGAADFTVSVTPPSATLLAGTAAAFTVTVTPTYGFSGTVTLAAAGAPPNSVITFNPPSVAGSGTSTMTVLTAATDAGGGVGSFSLAVTGTSGSLVRGAAASLTMQDFALVVSPGKQTVVHCTDSVTYQIQAVGVNGFNAPVNVFFMGLQPTATLGSASLTGSPVSGTQTAALIFSLNLGGSCNPYPYGVQIRGSSGGVSHTFLAEMDVNMGGTADFSVTVNPPSSTGTPPGSIGYNVTVNSAFGYSGSVTLTAANLPAGTTVIFGPNPVTVTASNAGYSGLTVTTTANTPAGPSSFTVTGTDASGTRRSFPVGLNVSAPTLATYTISGQVTFGGTGLFGVTVNLSGTVAGQAITSAAGAYSFTVATGSYTVMPVMAGYTFSPALWGPSNVASNQPGVNFSAQQATLPNLQQMATWAEFIDRHETLVGPNGPTDNGGFYGLAGGDAATVNSLTDSAQQQLVQLQAQASSYSDGYAFANAHSRILQNLSSQLQQQVSAPSWQTLTTYLDATIAPNIPAEGLDASSPPNGGNCDPSAQNCMDRKEEINFFYGGGNNNWGLGAFEHAWVDGVDESEYTSTVKSMKETFAPPGVALNCGVDNPGSTVLHTQQQDSTTTGPLIAGEPHTEQNPQRGTYMIEAFDSYVYTYWDAQGGTQNTAYPPFSGSWGSWSPPAPATDSFNNSNGYDCYQVPVDLQLQVQGAQMDPTGQIATVTSCSSPTISVSLAFTPPVPVGNVAPPVVWSGGTAVDNLHVTVPCVAGTNATIKAWIKQKSGDTPLLQPQVTVVVQPTVTIDRPKVVTGAGSSFSVTASSTIPANGTYTWEIIATQPGDDPTIATLPASPPTCNGQASCPITVEASASGGKATLRAHFKSGSSDITADTRVVVVQITSVVATVSSHVGADLTKSFPLQITASAGALQWPDDMWSGTTPMVLVRDSLPGVALQAFTYPLNGDSDVVNSVAFAVFRAGDDSPSIPGYPNVPSLQQPSSLGSTTLALNQTGSFQVLAFVDANGNGQWDVGETGLSLPLILVQAVLNQNLSSSPNSVATYQELSDSGTWTASKVYTGQPVSCGTGVIGSCTVDLNAEVDLIGGFQDGLRGVDRVFGGWVQNMNTPDVVASYQNSHQDSLVFASNIPPNKVFLPTSDDPAIIDGPLLDTSRGDTGTGDPQPGQGGNTSTMANSAMTPSSTMLSLGRRVVIEAADFPSTQFPAIDYAYTTSALTQIRYNLTFNSFLTLWSSAAGVNGGTGAVADRTYAVILRQPWNIISGFTVDSQGNGSPTSMPTAVTLDPNAAQTYNPVVPVMTPPRVKDVTADNFKQ